MATTNIDVNKQNVVDLLKSAKDHPFVIPEYQRPYAWGDDEINTLFDDLWNFSIERDPENGPQTYFLGSIVSFENEKGEKEIIDGQQRITSLFLLLRAVYSKLEAEENRSKEVINFMNKIQPALWKEDEMTGEVDKSKILLRSEVVTDSGNALLAEILEKGVTRVGACDNYSRNYNNFLALYESKAKESPTQIYQFIVSLLNYAILLPISADNQDTALTIFSTLNNRGLPLSDADIFKSHIYKKLSADDKVVFIQKWKELSQDATNANENVQWLFYYNMFYIRALNGDDKTTTPGIRKYYLDKNFDRLNVSVIDTLKENLKLWQVINKGVELEDESWSKNVAILQVLDCLKSYSNEFWKYPVSIFYNQHKKNDGFESAFLCFLRKFCVMLLTRFIESPTISAIKSDILKLNVQITKTMYPAFFAGFRNQVEMPEEDYRLVLPNKRLERMLLKIVAYTHPNQTTLLPERWECEHIFPQKWDTAFYTIPIEEIKAHIEQLGNKIPLEKPRNIRASNGYFAYKKDEYKLSSIAVAKELGNSMYSEWYIQEIKDRNNVLIKTLVDTFAMFVDEYDKQIQPVNAKSTPTPEQAEMIRKLQEAGLYPM